MSEDSSYNEKEALENVTNETRATLSGAQVNYKRKERLKVQRQLYDLSDINGEKYYETVRSLVNEFSERCLIDIESSNPEDFLEKYAEVWEDYLDKAKKMDVRHDRLNKTFLKKKQKDFHAIPAPIDVKEDQKYFTISSLMKKSWFDSIAKIKTKLAEVLFKSMQDQKGRESEQIEQFAKTIVESIDECEKYVIGSKAYIKVLENPLIEQVENHYKALSEELLSKSNEDYVATCHGLLQEEKKIAEKIFPKSEKVIYEAAWKCMVLNHSESITSSLESFFSLDQRDKLKLSYELLSFKPRTLRKFCEVIQSHEEQTLLELRKSTEDSLFCEKFIERFKKIQHLINSNFESTDEVKEAVDMAIKKVLNKKLKKEANDPNEKGANSISEISSMIVAHCDNFFKKGMNGLGDEALSERLDGISIIFNYVDDKDIFHRLYAKSLAKRLINLTSKSIDAERELVERLKSCTEKDYVVMLEKMIGDYNLSLEEAQMFKKSLNTSFTFSFNVMIFQSSTLTIGESRSKLFMPQELEQRVQLFNQFYVNRHNGRKLLWNHDMSSCEVKLNNLKRPYGVQMSVATLTVLTPFNTNDSFKTSDLMTTTGMELEDLGKQLKCLIKEKILLCEDVHIVEGSTIERNRNYENKRQKFKLLVQLKDQNRETEQAIQGAQEERKFFLQALIVKIMKGKKAMAHADLVNEVVSKSIKLFVPSVSLITKNISILIEKEYLEKKENVYHYLA